MKIKKLLGTLFVATATVASLASCKEKVTTVEAGYLTVITSSDYAPYEFIDQTKTGQDKFVGSDITMAKYMANEMGLKLKIKAMGFDTSLSGIDTDKGDIFIAGITWKEERAAQYLYSDAYFNDGDGDQILLMTKDNAAKYTTIESMNNSDCKIAVQAASVQYDLVNANMPKAEKVVIQDLNQAVDLLSQGSYTAVAIAGNAAQQMIKVKQNLAISDFYFEVDEKQGFLYSVMKKGNTELAAEINKVIESIQKDDLYTTWLKEATDLFDALGESAGEFIPEESEESSSTTA